MTTTAVLWTLEIIREQANCYEENGAGRSTP